MDKKYRFLFLEIVDLHYELAYAISEINYLKSIMVLLEYGANIKQY